MAKPHTPIGPKISLVQSGIRGLGLVKNSGAPRGRHSLIRGGAGARKTLFTNSETVAPRVELVLYIGGATKNSRLAVLNIKGIGERFLHGRYDLAVVDLLQDPEQCQKHDVLAVPMLVRHSPLPQRRMVGKLANKDRVMLGLDLVSVPAG